jgi:hypothetical protein
VLRRLSSLEVIGNLTMRGTNDIRHILALSSEGSSGKRWKVLRDACDIVVVEIWQRFWGCSSEWLNEAEM